MFLFGEIYKMTYPQLLIEPRKFPLSPFQSSFDLNLNSLLVKRQIDNPSLGGVTGGRGCDWGKLVPSSHKRGELRYT